MAQEWTVEVVRSAPVISCRFSDPTEKGTLKTSRTFLAFEKGTEKGPKINAHPQKSPIFVCALLYMRILVAWLRTRYHHWSFGEIPNPQPPRLSKPGNGWLPTKCMCKMFLRCIKR